MIMGARDGELPGVLMGEKIDEGDTKGVADCGIEIIEMEGTVETEGARDIKERGKDVYREEIAIGGMAFRE